MTYKKIAEKIYEYLKKFESDPKINKLKKGRTIPPFYDVNVWTDGRCVLIHYISFQIESRLTKQEAARYLLWLDAGNKGKHNQIPEEVN